MDAKADRSAFPFQEDAHSEKAARIVKRLFRDYPGSMAVRFGNGETRGNSREGDGA